MTNRVITKLGIILLTADEMVGAIQRIEGMCPGWWYSLSQTIDGTTLMLGPGRKGPHPMDLELALTKEGDEGFPNKYAGPHPISRFQKIEIDDFIRDSIALLNEKRGLLHTPEVGIFPRSGNDKYRYQTDENLSEFTKEYNRFLSEVNMYETRGHLFTEIYFGSCDTSADCSLRGDRADGTKFDISVDLAEGGSLDQSLHWSMSELKGDILTHVSNIRQAPNLGVLLQG